MTNLPTIHTQPFVKITLHYGFVSLSCYAPKFDKRGRWVGNYMRVKDSDGRDEILPPACELVYEDSWWEKLWDRLTSQHKETNDDKTS